MSLKPSLGHTKILLHLIRLSNHISFYAGGQLRCFVDDEEVVAQEGNFYGGWKTSEISGGEKGIKGGKNPYQTRSSGPSRII
ncbi:hypothetical protein PSHT_04819 [Puccinia striiformis]|uniref:Uncharacterized protein n=1 Tax=Puccinia striiformis TaxID=27350 RepID=A0A2S4WC32_9BASI|nr:hypothetical protein PSHT_04819 [Puccinia striiformis]